MTKPTRRKSANKLEFLALLKEMPEALGGRPSQVIGRKATLGDLLEYLNRRETIPAGEPVTLREVLWSSREQARSIVNDTKADLETRMQAKLVVESIDMLGDDPSPQAAIAVLDLSDLWTRSLADARRGRKRLVYSSDGGNARSAKYSERREKAVAEVRQLIPPAGGHSFYDACCITGAKFKVSYKTIERAFEDAAEE